MSRMIETFCNNCASTVRALVPDEVDPFSLGWPAGVEQGEFYEVLCDDKGHKGGTWLRVLVAGDGDVHVSMQDWETVPEGRPQPLPSLRVRTYNGGGRNHRTRLMLLWLALAMKLDAADNTHLQQRTEAQDTPE